MILVIILVSIGGCCMTRDADDRGGRAGEYDRDRGYERVEGHDIRNTITIP
jgi:hypothetical protein